jgi:hypothetical protein
MEKYVKNLHDKSSRQIFTNFLIFLFVTLLFSSCSKEQNENIANDDTLPKSEIDLILEQTLLPVSVENNTLIFSSEENYQKTIDFLVSIGDENFDAFEEYYGFTSLRKSDAFADIKEDTDPLFASLLNTNSEIIIGPHKFTLDFENNKVIANLLTYSDDGAKSIDETELVFEFTDDVFTIIEEGTQSKADYCGQREDGISFPAHVLAQGGYMSFFSKYVTTGIYNTVSIHVEQNFYNDYNYNAILRGSYTVTGESTWSNAITSGTFDGIDLWCSTQYNNEVLERPYARSRRLDCLYLKVYCYTSDTGSLQYNCTGNYYIGCHSTGESCLGYGGDK